MNKVKSIAILAFKIFFHSVPLDMPGLKDVRHVKAKKLDRVFLKHVKEQHYIRRSVKCFLSTSLDINEYNENIRKN